MDIQSLYNAIDAAKIDDFIANRQEENLHLDFKLANDPNMTRDDRKNLAKALSGFANSDGGIVVWGVNARPNLNGIDCASGKQEIASVSLFLSKLNEFIGDLVNPTVDGVVHRKIVVTHDSGFAVTLVPPSDCGPHMAKGGEDRYYKRSGDSFRRMEHFDIADMFGRRKRPILRLRPTTQPVSKTQDCRVVLGLENEGRGSARAPFLSIEVAEPYHVSKYGIDGNFHFGLPPLAQAMGSRRKQYGGGSDITIHPGTRLDVTVIEGPIAGDMVIHYQIAAEDSANKSGELIIRLADLFLGPY
jgi:hypothetical protein